MTGAFSSDMIYAPLDALENATKQYDRASQPLISTTATPEIKHERIALLTRLLRDAAPGARHRGGRRDDERYEP